ncbi:MAG: hypothetical protein HC918_04320 [Oscillatoriales cyanobacterium SM2_1_8]|nr:hypothetical protein [Oscillatoriales cyanobacterium SM2_1_8]
MVISVGFFGLLSQSGWRWQPNQAGGLPPPDKAQSRWLYNGRCPGEASMNRKIRIAVADGRFTVRGGKIGGLTCATPTI